MSPKDTALRRLHVARDMFHCSAASYALLTSPVTGPTLTQYQVIFHESGFQVVPLDAAKPGGISLTIQFGGAITDGAATEMMHVVYEKMICDSVEATRAYARWKGELGDLLQQEWFAVAQHLRNAFSHSGKWSFPRDRHPPLPATWNYKFTVTREMAGKPARGFLPWFWGTRLCAQMILYVSGVVDYRQEMVKKAASGQA